MALCSILTSKLNYVIGDIRCAFLFFFFFGAGLNKDSGTDKEEETPRKGPAIIVVLVLGGVAVGFVVGCKNWRKKKQQQEQAWFLKLFEDGDEMEVEICLEDTL